MGDAPNELDVAHAIAEGRLTSPQRYENVWLFAIRITGTGYAYRPKHDEFVFRPPEKYLNEEFLARCNGMPVLIKHPDKSLLDGKEFAEWVVGSIFAPYISADEVWGVAKIYDDDAAERMMSGELSTSPAVFFRAPDVNQKIALDGGAKLLVEGDPSLVDHIALCERGVWDKGNVPSGVRADSKGETKMPEEKKDEPAVAGLSDVNKKLDAIVHALGTMCERIEAIEEAEKARTDQAKKDAEEEERCKNGDPVQLAADAAKAKADAAEIKKRIDEVAAMVKPVADDDHAKLAEEWTRADEAFTALGKPTPRTIPGETAPMYRRRITRTLKEWSPRWKDVDLSSQAFADESGFAVVADQVRADAIAMGMSPATAPNGGLRMISKTIDGHIHNTFVGDPSAWMSRFSGGLRKVKSIGFRDSEGRWVSQWTGG